MFKDVLYTFTLWNKTVFYYLGTNIPEKGQEISIYDVCFTF